jgi:hypothetical protein
MEKEEEHFPKKATEQAETFPKIFLNKRFNEPAGQ